MLEKSLSLPLVRYIALLVGALVLLFGVADIFSRVGSAVFGGIANTEIFGTPAAQSASGQMQGQPEGQVALLGAPMLATTTPIIPTRLKINSIGVDAAVELVGKTATGAMGTPRSFNDVGWYALGAKPGEAGSAVIDGHVNNALTRAGVFEHLSLVKVGDTVSLSDTSNRTLVYTVSEIDEYPAEGAPAASIFTSTGPSQLVLITCDGSWNGSAHTFDKRLVVYARLSVR